MVLLRVRTIHSGSHSGTLSRHWTSWCVRLWCSQCRMNVDPASTTLDQHSAGIAAVEAARQTYVLDAKCFPKLICTSHKSLSAAHSCTRWNINPPRARVSLCRFNIRQCWLKVSLGLTLETPRTKAGVLICFVSRLNHSFGELKGRLDIKICKCLVPNLTNARNFHNFVWVKI